MMLPELKPYADVAFANHDTIQNTYDLAYKAIVEGIPGDFVECGVAAGAQIGVMGHVCRKLVDRRRIWGFDSFQGIPIAGPQDDDQPGLGAKDPKYALVTDSRQRLVSSGVAAVSLDQVIANLARWGLELAQYKLIEGWFQDTMQSAGSYVEQIAVLRLDGDLYESTRVCLEKLHPKVSKSGFVIIDDYALGGARRAVEEYFASHNLSYKPIPVDPKLNEVHWYQVT